MNKQIDHLDMKKTPQDMPCNTNARFTRATLNIDNIILDKEIVYCYC